MADKRAFALFDVGYLDNPKIMDVFDASPIAVCMHFASVLYCAQHLTDGEIALRAMERKVGGTSDDSKLLIDAGLWHLPGHDCPNCPDVRDGKAYVHDYLQHNRTSEGVKGKSQAGKLAAEARWAKKKSDAERNANSNASRMQSASEPHSEPQYENDDSVMPRKKEEKERKEDLLKDSSDWSDDDTPPAPIKYSDQFEAFWSSYPLKVGKKAAFDAFKRAVRTSKVSEICLGAARFAADPNRDDAFTPHASTWLNGARWDDPPLPDRTNSGTARPSGSQTRAQAGLARLAAYDETGRTQYTPTQLELGA